MHFLTFVFILSMFLSCKKGASSLKDTVVLERMGRRIYIERLVLKEEYIIEKKYLFNEILWKEIELEWKIEGIEEEQGMFKFNKKNLKPTSIEIPEGIEIPEELSIEFHLAGGTFLLNASLGQSDTEEGESATDESTAAEEENPNREDELDA